MTQDTIRAVTAAGSPLPTSRGLARSMKGFGALLITLSGLSPTFGVFVIGSDVIRQAGTGALACFLAAALLGLAMASIYAELGSAFPHAGGEYTVLTRTLGPVFGFMALGLNLVTLGVGSGIGGLGFADYLELAVPGLPILPTAIVATAVVTAIAILNIRVNAWVTGCFLAIELAALAVVACLGLVRPERNLGDLLLHPVALSAHGPLAPVSISVLGVAAVGAIFAYNGYGGVIFLGEEIHDAQRRIGGVVYAALAIGVVTQIGPIAAILSGAPHLTHMLGVTTPVPEFALETGGRTLATVLGFGVALAIFNANIAITLLAGRQLYCTARDGVWPRAWNRLLVQVHPTLKSPWLATLAMGAMAALGCLIGVPFLVTLTGNGVVFVYAGLAAAVIVGRRTGSTAHSMSRAPGFPVGPVAALLALVAVAVADLLDPETGRPSLLADLCLVAAFGAYYWLIVRRKGAWSSVDAD